MKIMITVGSASRWKQKDRVAINLGTKAKPEFYLGTVTKLAKGPSDASSKVYVRFDDGTKDSFPAKSIKIFGPAVDAQNSEAITKAQLSKWLTKRNPKDQSVDYTTLRIVIPKTALTGPSKIKAIESIKKSLNAKSKKENRELTKAEIKAIKDRVIAKAQKANLDLSEKLSKGRKRKASKADKDYDRKLRLGLLDEQRGR